MRVLHISAGKLYGGVEALLLTLARHGQLCPELEQEFALCFEGRISEELVSARARVHMFGHVRVRRPITIWLARRRLQELLRRASFDLVICHMAWAQAIFGSVVRASRIPLILWHHDPSPGVHWLDRWARLTPPDLAICNSQFTAGNLRRTHPGVRAEVVYCPVELPKLQGSERAAPRAEAGTPEGATVIVQVGRMEAYKGHLQHLEALGALRDRPGWIGWQVGEAQRADEVRYIESLKAAATRLGIAERVRFLGYWPNLWRLLNAADIYCQPNIGPEGFGITLVEALHAGLPVVTTLLGPAREIVNDSCGILVPPDDRSALATALRRLIDDPARRAKLGSAGPTRAKELCDPVTQMRRLEALLSSVVSGAEDRRMDASALACAGR